VIAGTVLPLQRAEELIATLPSVVSVRIVPTDSGGVSAIHLLTTGETAAKQMVRNVESALMAHLGMRVDHRKVSVATTTTRPTPPAGVSQAVVEAAMSAPAAKPSVQASDQASVQASVASAAPVTPVEKEAMPEAHGDASGRTMYFVDVEVRGSRAKGAGCRVTLRRGDEAFVGEADGVESDRSRVELAARATLAAIAKSDGGQERRLSFEGSKIVAAFDKEFVFVGVTVRHGRESWLLTGSAEVKDSAETAAVLAVLDATNRWVAGRVG